MDPIVKRLMEHREKLAESYIGFNEYLQDKYGISSDDMTDDDYDTYYAEYEEYMKEENHSKICEAYKIRYSYEGDSLSDYEGDIIIKADSEDEAIEKAKAKLPDAWNFRVEDEIPDLEAYKKEYPKSNIEITESSEDYLYDDEYKDMLRKITDIVWDRLLASVDNLEEVLKSEVEGYDPEWSGRDNEEIHQLFTDLSSKLALNMMKNCDVKW